MRPDRTRWAAPELRLGTWTVSSYHASGLLGIVTAVALTQILAAVLGLRPAVMAAASASAVAAFFALALLVRWILGVEKLVYYHQELAVLAAAWLTLTVIGAPAARYLDLVQLGIAAFLVWGRIGCLLVGCCHGRPARFGVRYGADHARLGFPGPLVGVRLVPVQGVESASVAVLLAVGTAAVLHGAAPGTVVTGYLTAYGLLRFGLEMLRGDAPRAAFLGVSHNQWTAVAIAAVLAASPGRRWPGDAASIGVAVLLAGTALTLVLLTWRRRRREARELAELMRGVRAPRGTAASRRR